MGCQMRRVAVLAPARRRPSVPAPAAELYASPLFRAAMAHCRGRYDAVYIISPLHDLLLPEQVIAPYDVNLNDRPPAARAAWGAAVSAELRRREPAAAFFLHAGRKYSRWLDLPGAVDVLAGLGIGRRLQWYHTQG